MDTKQFISDHPLPGASLTNSPENKLPFEQPPKYVDEQEAKAHIWKNLTRRENISEVLRLIRRDIPVADIAQVITFSGFANGKWSQDMSLMLLEPTMLMVMDLAHAAGVDYVFSNEMPDLKAEISGERDKMLKKEMGDTAPDGLMVDEGEQP